MYDTFSVNLNCVGKTLWDAQLQLAVCQALPSCFMTSQKTMMGMQNYVFLFMSQVESYFGISSITMIYYDIKSVIAFMYMCLGIKIQY